MSTQENPRQDAAHLLDRERSLVRLRRFYHRVRSLALAPEPDFQRIAEVLAEEGAFSQLVLRVVNSTRTGLFHPIRSVRHAVALLGAAGVYALAEAELNRLREPWLQPRDTNEVPGKPHTLASGETERAMSLMQEPTEPRRSRSA